MEGELDQKEEEENTLTAYMHPSRGPRNPHLSSWIWGLTDEPGFLSSSLVDLSGKAEAGSLHRWCTLSAPLPFPSAQWCRSMAARNPPTTSTFPVQVSALVPPWEGSAGLTSCLRCAQNHDSAVFWIGFWSWVISLSLTKGELLSYGAFPWGPYLQACAQHLVSPICPVLSTTWLPGEVKWLHLPTCLYLPKRAETFNIVHG